MANKIFITDFDGTLATHDGLVSQKNREALKRLSKNGIVRVIATGRNLYSARKVISSDFPVDYVIFTTGAGLIHWPTQKILVSHHMDQSSIDETFECFKENFIDFMVHEPIPNNHFFQFFATGLENLDFEFRKQHYGSYSKMGLSGTLPKLATQFLGVLRPEQSERVYSLIKDSLRSLNVVRATSPFDHQSIWVEVFSKRAAKDLTSQYLAEKLGFSRLETVAIGNDYNDEGLLNWSGKSFVVENAIDKLKSQFESVAHVDQDGFAEAVNRILK